jgi:hypothetical protein
MPEETSQSRHEISPSPNNPGTFQWVAWYSSGTPWRSSRSASALFSGRAPRFPELFPITGRIGPEASPTAFRPDRAVRAIRTSLPTGRPRITQLRRRLLTRPARSRRRPPRVLLPTMSRPRGAVCTKGCAVGTVVNSPQFPDPAAYATPARSRSWKCTMPTGRSAATTKSAVIFDELRICNASLAN